MREIWVADSETDPFEHGAEILPFIWGCYNGNTYHEFTDTSAFVDFISCRKCIVYAHNGGKFDWHFLLNRMEPFSPIMLIGGRIAKFTIGEAEFRDSYNILPAPLSAYKKDEIDYSKFTRANRDKFMHEIRDYLRSDCVYLFDFVSEFIRRYGISLTFASAAMKEWQKLENIEAPQTSGDFYQTFAPYYYGGRVQAFHMGLIETPFTVYDINSAYPFAMKHVHPYGDVYAVGDELCPHAPERQFITLSARSLGAFPFRQPDGSLEFPEDGEIRIFNVTGWEFLAARDTGCLRDFRVLRTITLPLTIQFNKYIDHFYDLKSIAKRTGDIAGYQFAKFFLNGLYGKFAANPEEYSEFQIVDPLYIHGAITDGWDFHAQLGPWALMARDLSENRQRYYNLAVGASITGFVRAHLWRALRTCKGVLYCDTDSIACRDGTALQLNDSELGAWSSVIDCDRGGIAGKKLYAFHSISGEWKTASKGARLNPQELLEVAAGEIVNYRPENPTFSAFTGIRYTSRDIKRKDVAKRKRQPQNKSRAQSAR